MSSFQRTRTIAFIKVSTVACLLAHSIYVIKPSYSADASNDVSTTETLPIQEDSSGIYAPPPPGYPINEVVLSTQDGKGRAVVMRRGWWDANKPNQGFGYDKIYHKHNITNKNAIKYVLHNPNGGEPDTGTARRYQAWAHLIKCRLGGLICRIADRREVRVVVDFRFDSNAKGQKGVITGYCIQTIQQGGDRCPDWVSKALNIQTANKDGQGSTFSYTARELNSDINRLDVDKEIIPNE